MNSKPILIILVFVLVAGGLFFLAPKLGLQLPFLTTTATHLSGSSLPQTDGCPTAEPQTVLTIDASRFAAVFRKEKTAGLYAKSQIGCLKPLDKVKLVATMKDPATLLPYRYGLELPAHVVRIESISYPDLAKTDLSAAHLAIANDKLMANFNRLYKPAMLSTGFYLIHFEVEKTEAFTINMRLPMTHPSAKTIPAAAAIAMVTSEPNTLLLDVRSAALRAQDSLPNSVHIPLSADNATGISVELAPLVLQERGWDEKLKDILLNKDQNVILFGQSSIDATPYNAITYLASKGMKKLFYVRDGYNGWKNIPTETPSEIAGVRVISAEQLLSLSKQDIKIVDVRPKPRFLAESIRGSTNLEYFQQKDAANQITVRTIPLTLQFLQEKKEPYDVAALTLKPKQAVVFYGENTSDWRAPKAALWAASQGFQVYWYRNGFYEWAAKEQVYPLQYQVRGRTQDLYETLD